MFIFVNSKHLKNNIITTVDEHIISGFLFGEINMINHKGTQTIRTDRLTLRKFNIHDYMDVFAWASNPQVLRYVCYKKHKNPPETKKILTGWIDSYENPETYNWAIEYNGKVIGNIALSGFDTQTDCHHLGWQIDSPYWNKGIMTEAARAVIDYLFDIGFEKIGAACNTENIGSAKVMQKIGMTKDFTLENVMYKKDGTFYNRDVYSVSK